MYEELIGELHFVASGVQSKRRRELLEKAANAIEELAKDLERSKEYETFWNKEAEEALRRFQVEFASKPRWIPVTERLPKECASVLVCFEFKGRKSVDVAQLWSDGDFHNYSDEYLTPEGKKYRVATHWMPLPELPKEET